MIHLKHLKFENGSVQLSSEELEKLLQAYKRSLQEHKRSLHALWMARAIWNHRVVVLAERDLEKCEPNTPMYSVCKLIFNKWQWAERKCLQKSKEFE